MIGIIGGYGEVGLHACLVLQKWGKQKLKIGGRNVGKGDNHRSNLIKDIQYEKMDIFKPDSLKNFIKGCDLVVNCAGPSHKISRMVAVQCIEHQVHLIDAGMGIDFEKNPMRSIEKSVVYAAGALPGLSGIFPRWAAQNFDQVHSLTSYTGGLDILTPAGAEDYIEGVTNGSHFPRAAWRGKMVPNFLQRKINQTLPFFPREHTHVPVFDEETKIIAEQLQLKKGDWFLAIEPGNTFSVLDSVSSDYQSSPRESTEKLSLATQLDIVGRKPYCNMLMQLEGIIAGKKSTQTFSLQAVGTIALTGSVAGTIAIATLEGKVKPGFQHASLVDNVGFILDTINQYECIQEINCFAVPISELLMEEAGSI